MAFAFRMPRSIAAATLSHRYIADRFLPDKAVDLVDEAASRLKIELDSMPTEIDQLERQIMQLEMEKQALRKERDAASKERLAKLEKELADLKEQSDRLKVQWQKEKEEITKSQKIAEQIEQIRTEFEQAQRRGDLQRASEIQYGKLPELQRQLDAIKAKESESGHMPPQGGSDRGRHRQGGFKLDGRVPFRVSRRASARSLWRWRTGSRSAS